MDNSILIGGGGEPITPITLNLKRANRHGRVAGATGTGKTVTLQVLAEGFARAGVPVFAADVKGDLSGASQTWDPSQPVSYTHLDVYKRQPWASPSSATKPTNSPPSTPAKADSASAPASTLPQRSQSSPKPIGTSA